VCRARGVVHARARGIAPERFVAGVPRSTDADVAARVATHQVRAVEVDAQERVAPDEEDRQQREERANPAVADAHFARPLVGMSHPIRIDRRPPVRRRCNGRACTSVRVAVHVCYR
jgi:hypothetical protein